MSAPESAAESRRSPELGAYMVQISHGPAPDFIPPAGILKASAVVPASALTGLFVDIEFRIAGGGTLRLGAFDLRKRVVV